MTFEAILLIVSVLTVFFAMARRSIGPELGMPVLALVALLIAGPVGAPHAIEAAFAEFGRIALLFTAVAMAAHQLRESEALKSVGLLAGQWAARAALHYSIPLRVGVPAICLVATWALAAVAHNTTSILVMAEVTYIVCVQFNVRPVPVLCGTLVASNLGGFSSRFGDTPNLIEARVWDLTHADFFPIMAINLGCVILLVAVVALLSAAPKLEPAEISVVEQGFVKARRDLSINKKLAASAIAGLLVIIVPAIWFPHHEFVFVAAGMLFLCMANLRYAGRGHHPFDVLGFETLVTLASVFVLATVLGSAELGISAFLQGWLQSSGAPVWAIIGISYVGTLFTEAASWANAVAAMVHGIDPSHRAAWALGSGICAGSSSLITAASAGIILLRQTARYPNGQVTFASYLWFGLGFSLLMVGYYTVVLSMFFPKEAL
ncbi:MAG: hypothetical protein KA257_08900 [Opitutaceae bacterium]|nr:hypothetical protein [Opitutaceae bacterium]